MQTLHLGLIDAGLAISMMQRHWFAPNDLVSFSDQIWICEHNPVFTLGLAGKAEHLLNPGSIPIVNTNRGGQVTYHGPGQVVAYPLLDLRSKGYFVKEYVFRLEEAVLRTLRHFGITGHRVRSAPGVYVKLDDPFGHGVLQGNSLDGLGKIAALGIKVSQHKTTHGVALNVAMDLSPYQRINPCGYSGLQTIDMRSLGVQVDWRDAAAVFARHLSTFLTP